jgi:hypothetical protein
LPDGVVAATSWVTFGKVHADWTVFVMAMPTYTELPTMAGWPGSENVRFPVRQSPCERETVAVGTEFEGLEPESMMPTTIRAMSAIPPPIAMSSRVCFVVIETPC